MRERTIFAILAIIVLIIIPIEKSADYEEKAPISMSCMNVEREVRTILGKRDGDISKKDLKKIRTLNIESMLVERLVDIEKMPNLQKLVLVETCTDNLKALNNNKSLKSLDISKNELTDTELNELSDLDNLEEIYISYNKISDISALAKFKNLRIIFADHNYINDFTALESLENLERLVISGNDVRNEIKLPNLPNLELINDEDSTYEDIEVQKMGLKYQYLNETDKEISYDDESFNREIEYLKSYGEYIYLNPKLRQKSKEAYKLYVGMKELLEKDSRLDDEFKLRVLSKRYAYRDDFGVYDIEIPYEVKLINKDL